MWNPFRSKLAASILAGVDNIHVRPGCKLLYLGERCGVLLMRGVLGQLRARASTDRPLAPVSHPCTIVDHPTHTPTHPH